MFAYLQTPFVPFATGEEGLLERGDILSRTEATRSGKVEKIDPKEASFRWT